MCNPRLQPEIGEEKAAKEIMRKVGNYIFCVKFFERDDGIIVMYHNVLVLSFSSRVKAS